MPVVFGLANYVPPLQIGARDMAFPRLNAFGFWCVPFRGILLHFSVLAGRASAVARSPITFERDALFLVARGRLLGSRSLGPGYSVQLVLPSTRSRQVISLRGPGMTMRRLSLFTSINLVDTFIIIFALPVLNADLAMILIDRQLQGHSSYLLAEVRPFCGRHFLGLSPFESLHHRPSRIRHRLRIIPVFSRNRFSATNLSLPSSVAIQS